MCYNEEEGEGELYKVIIIDDNKLIADSLGASPIWPEYGCEVASVCYDSYAGKEAIEALTPDIIMTDIKMPGLTGLDVIELIRPKVPDARVIFISAYDNFQYAQQALRLGAQDYLLKPFSQETLIHAISNSVNVLDAMRKEKQAQRPEPSADRDIPADAPIVRPIIEYMMERIDQHLTAEEVARAFYMSTSRLDKLIQKYNGKGFQKLHIHLRMNKAKELLMDVRNNIEDIAQKTGYKNYASFYRAFTREFSMSPTEYREMMQRK